MSLKVEQKGNSVWITFNNARRRNCINLKMYKEIIQAMDDADANEDILYTVFTGEGDFYSSGNDFSPAEFTPEALDVNQESPYMHWVRRLIEHSKILIALVNGPAIGVSCTTLALFDYIVCSSSTYFSTPFSQMGVCPEACSSVLFQQILGVSKANDMLLFGEVLSAEEALARGFVGRIFPKEQFRQKAQEFMDKLYKWPKHSLLISKRLLRPEGVRDLLHAANNHEHKQIKFLFNSPETIELMQKKFTPKI